MSWDVDTQEWFPGFRDAYRREFGFELLRADAEGRLLGPAPPATACRCGGRSAARRREAAAQTLCWGETVINLCCDDGYALWTVPLTCNNRTTGMLVVQGVDLEAGGRALAARVQRAAETLLQWAERDNRVNSAALQLGRQRAAQEAARFRALEQAKHFAADDLRSLYLREEPELLSAIKHGRRTDARAILNRILVSIYSLAGPRMDLLKSCVLELIVMMSRAAVEAGADPATLLGVNFCSLAELAGIADEEDLARWVRHMLETLIEAIRANDRYPHSLLLARALSYMRDNLGRNLRRDEVARHAGVSPGHFSEVMTERMGRSFSDMLAQMRVERAKDLLRQTRLSLSAIALECGFCDQSHLTKVFRRLTGQPPGAFRRQLPRALNPPPVPENPSTVQ